MEEEAVRYEVHGPSFASFRKGGLRIQSLLLDGIKLDQIERSYERFDRALSHQGGEIGFAIHQMSLFDPLLRSMSPAW